MGIEGRDWYREESRRAQSRSGARARVLAGVLVGIVIIVAASRPGLDRGRGATGLRFEPIPGLPGITIGEQSLYSENDPWREWLADEATCPRGEDVSAPPEIQVQVMLCLLNHARDQQGLSRLGLSSVLGATAGSKARDIVLCKEFSHEACGKRPFQAADDMGYSGAVGENLYVGEGPLMAPRPAVDSWLNSAGHRENLFEPAWRTIGISRLEGATLDDIDDGVVWVNHFGT